jgi:hypothetical protein
VKLAEFLNKLGNVSTVTPDKATGTVAVPGEFIFEAHFQGWQIYPKNEMTSNNFTLLCCRLT